MVVSTCRANKEKKENYLKNKDSSIPLPLKAEGFRFGICLDPTANN
jgi:hypothetical protein